MTRFAESKSLTNSTDTQTVLSSHRRNAERRMIIEGNKRSSRSLTPTLLLHTLGTATVLNPQVIIHLSALHCRPPDARLLQRMHPLSSPVSPSSPCGFCGGPVRGPRTVARRNKNHSRAVNRGPLPSPDSPTLRGIHADSARRAHKHKDRLARDGLFVVRELQTETSHTHFRESAATEAIVGGCLHTSYFILLTSYSSCPGITGEGIPSAWASASKSAIASACS